MINRASAELEQRALGSNPENKVIFDGLGTTITVTGMEMKKTLYYDPGLVLYATIVNTSDLGLEGIVNVSVVNGWEVEHTGLIDISAGHKEKAEFSFDLAGIEVESMEQLDTLEISFSYTISGLNMFTDTKSVTIDF
jgi:hypothetical protein